VTLLDSRRLVEVDRVGFPGGTGESGNVGCCDLKVEIRVFPICPGSRLPRYDRGHSPIVFAMILRCMSEVPAPITPSRDSR